MTGYGIQLRQPMAGDLIGRSLAIAAVGTAFEASYGWRLLADGHELDTGFFMAGSMGLMESFVHSAVVESGHVGPATFQLFGDDPSGERDPGLDTQSVAVIVIGGMQGYRVHQVVRGDTLSGIARDTGSTVAKIVAANSIANPDLIRVGQILRVPI